jgi:hypothetical protein
MLLKNKELHEDAHLPSIARPFHEAASAAATTTSSTTTTATIATTPKRPKRYLLKRAATAKGQLRAQLLCGKSSEETSGAR